MCWNISLFGILTFRERREAQLVLNILEVSTHISPKVQGSIVSSRSPSEAFPLYKRFPLESLWFCSFRPNPDIPKNSKMCYYFGFMSLSKSCLSVTKAFICSIKISGGNFFFTRGGAIELLNILIVASES